MRTIEWTSAFKRDFRKVGSNTRYRDLDALIELVGTGWQKMSLLRPSIATILLAVRTRDIANAISSLICC
jgi:hypothetical protein